LQQLQNSKLDMVLLGKKLHWQFIAWPRGKIEGCSRSSEQEPKERPSEHVISTTNCCSLLNFGLVPYPRHNSIVSRAEDSLVFISSWKLLGKSAYKAQLFGSSTPRKRKEKEKKNRLDDDLELEAIGWK